MMRAKVAVLIAFFLTGTALAEKNVIITLDSAIEIAEKNNLQVRIADEKIKQAEYGREISQTFFRPRISSSFRYTRLDEVQKMMGMTITDANMYNIGITLSQPLYTGGKLNAAYLQARENVNRTGFEKESVVNNLVEDITRGYFSILKAEKGLETVKRLKELAREHLRTTKAFFEEGLATRADVLKTEVFLADTEKRILQADNSLSIARAGFSFLLNQPLSTEFVVEDILDIPREKKDLEYWIERAYGQRPELKVMKSAGEIYEYSIEVEKSGHKPRIALFSNYMLDRGTQGAVDEWQDSWNIGVSVELDIWNWGETRKRVERAVREKKEIELQFSLLVKSVELEVKSAYLNLKTAGKQIEVVKKSLVTAEENLRVTNMLYREGMTTTTEVLDAQTDLAAVMNSFYQSLYDYQIAYAELEKAAGMQVVGKK